MVIAYASTYTCASYVGIFITPVRYTVCRNNYLGYKIQIFPSFRLKRLAPALIVKPQKVVAPWSTCPHRVSASSDRLDPDIPWITGTLQGLDLTAMLHPWRLVKAAEDKVASEKKTLSASSPEADVSSLTSPSRLPTGVSRSTDPVWLPDSALREIKQGVKTPQTYHAIITAQVSFAVSIM